MNEQSETVAEYLSRIGKKGGASKSGRKAEAARANVAKARETIAANKRVTPNKPLAVIPKARKVIVPPVPRQRATIKPVNKPVRSEPDEEVLMVRPLDRYLKPVNKQLEEGKEYARDHAEDAPRRTFRN